MDIESIEELDRLLAATKADYNEKHSALKSAEAELKETNLLIKNTGQYLANKDTYRQYMKSKTKAKFREEHITEITLYEAARKALKDAGYLQNLQQQQKSQGQKAQGQKSLDQKSQSQKSSEQKYLPNMKSLKSKKQELTAQKNSLYEDYTYQKYDISGISSHKVKSY